MVVAGISALPIIIAESKYYSVCSIGVGAKGAPSNPLTTRAKDIAYQHTVKKKCIRLNESSIENFVNKQLQSLLWLT